MKFQEACEMILDGGRMYRENNKNIKFNDTIAGDLICYMDNEEKYNFCTPYKEDIIATNWIVEKDGKIYEEYQINPNEETKKAREVCPECNNDKENVLGFMLCTDDACRKNRLEEEIKKEKFFNRRRLARLENLSEIFIERKEE